MDYISQIIDDIKEELASPEPSSTRIITHLIDLRTKKKFQQLSESQFFDIVGETFKMNPDFFMKELYNPFWSKMGKIYGDKNLAEMERYIIEKFCLYEEEQILYECKGNIKLTEVITQNSGKWTSQPLKISINSGDLFFTNYRIIAHGIFKISGGQKVNSFWDYIPLIEDLVDHFTYFPFSGRSRRAKEKKHIIDGSIYQELPCYGYQFPIKNHTGLSKNDLSYSVRYHFKIDNRRCIFSIKAPKSSNKEKSVIIMHDIFDILSKVK
ncbi:MAG: hypothetical protein ACFFAQ_05185 [Promethearchaeota archaeon]